MVNMEYINEAGVLDHQGQPPFHHSLEVINGAISYYLASGYMIEVLEKTTKEPGPNEEDRASMVKFYEATKANRIEILERKADEIRKALHVDMLPAANAVYVARINMEPDEETEVALASCTLYLETLAAIANKTNWTVEDFIEAMDANGLEAIRKYSENLLQALEVRNGQDMFNDMFKK